MLYLWRLHIKGEKQMTKPIPPDYHTLTPTITVHNALEAIEFYKKAFGAQVQKVHNTPDGKVMHASLKIGDSQLMLSDEFPDWNCKSPNSIGGTGSGIYVYVEKVDDVFDRAVKAGAVVTMPPTDQFWGDRMGQFIDPYGHRWSLATHVEDVSDEEMTRRRESMIKEMAGAKK
jgi:PhnB protein